MRGILEEDDIIKWNLDNMVMKEMDIDYIIQVTIRLR